MRTEIQEIQIEIANPDSTFRKFCALVRDGGLESIDHMLVRHSSMPTPETIRAYIQFLQEVLKAMRD